jgi:hypothetical protein
MVEDLVRWINKGQQLVHVNLAIVEKKYMAQYVGDLCIEGSRSGGWTNEPLAIFWQEKLPQPDYTHYFGLFIENRNVMITGAGSVAVGLWDAAQANNGEIIFSRFRNDHRISGDGTASVDGGRDYFKYRGAAVQLRLDGPDFRVV